MSIFGDSGYFVSRLFRIAPIPLDAVRTRWQTTWRWLIWGFVITIEIIISRILFKVVFYLFCTAVAATSCGTKLYTLRELLTMIFKRWCWKLSVPMSVLRTLPVRLILRRLTYDVPLVANHLSFEEMVTQMANSKLELAVGEDS